MASDYPKPEGGATLDARRSFVGAKLMLFAGPLLIALRRDRTPGIEFPGCLDFPGGGREGDESPEDCVLRETHEELGLEVPVSLLQVAHLRRSLRGHSWFFAAHLAAGAEARVVFGGEGAGWQAMRPEAFVAAQDAVPHFRHILAAYLAERPDLA